MTDLDARYDENGRLHRVDTTRTITQETVRKYNRQIDEIKATVTLVLRDMQAYPPEYSCKIPIDGKQRAGWCLYKWETGKRIKVSLFAGCYLLSDGTFCIHGENETTRRVPLHRVSGPEVFSQDQSLLSPWRMQEIHSVLHGTGSPPDDSSRCFSYSIMRVGQFRRGRGDHDHLKAPRKRRTLSEFLGDLYRG